MATRQKAGGAKSAAAKKTASGSTPAKRVVLVDPREDAAAAATRAAAEADAARNADAQKTLDETKKDPDDGKKARKRAPEIVTVSVPNRFRLTEDDGSTTTDYHPGIQDMPRAHAEHWFAKAHGVEIEE